MNEKKVAIIGYGVVGKAAAYYCAQQGGILTVFDQRTEDQLPQEARDFFVEKKAIFVGGAEEAEDLTRFDLIVSSPGIARSRRDLAEAEEAGVPLYTDITLFLECWKGSGKIIGVTGSNGKSTVVSLFEAALQDSGKSVLMGGNIGNSPLEWLTDPEAPQDATIVLELSSYMLEYFNDDHVLDVSVIISFSQNHLSRHGTLDVYAQAKAAGIKDGHTKVYLGDTEGVRQYIVPVLKTQEYAFMDIAHATDLIEDVDQVAMLGDHNLINIGLVTEVLQDLDLCGDEVRQALKDYPGLGHRIEFVTEKDNVRWINDSKSTSPDATIKALEAVNRPGGKVVLVAGGVDKGVTYESWREYFNPESMRAVVLLPGPADQEITKIAQEEKVPVLSIEEQENTQVLMQEIVKHVQSLAQSGDTVLLSPGAASLNLWSGFEARGKDFADAIG